MVTLSCKHTRSTCDVNILGPQKKIPESLNIVPFRHKHTRTLTFGNFCLDDLEILISNHIDFALTENLTDWPVARKAIFFY
jgi:hypothetical protein